MLSNRSVRLLHTQNVPSVAERLFAVTNAAVGDDDIIPKSIINDGLFPWSEFSQELPSWKLKLAALEYTGTAKLNNMMLESVKKGDTDNNKYKVFNYMPTIDEMVEGGQQAFTVAVEAVFQNQLLANSASNSHDRKHELNEIFEQNLATFFENAMKHSNSKSHRTHYKLHEIHSVIVTCYEAPLDDHEETGVMPEKDIQRFTLEIDCTEEFYEENTVTLEILQGSKDKRTVTHEIVLETAELRHQPHSWFIVDIDNWLDGNVKPGVVFEGL